MSPHDTFGELHSNFQQALTDADGGRGLDSRDTVHRNCYYRIYFTFANQTKIFILFKSIVKSVSSFLKSELRLVTSLNKVFWFKLILVLRTTLLAFTSLKLPVDILQQLFLGDQVTCPGCRLNAFACKCLQGTEDGRYLHLYSS